MAHWGGGKCAVAWSWETSQRPHRMEMATKKAWCRICSQGICVSAFRFDITMSSCNLWWFVFWFFCKMTKMPGLSDSLRHLSFKHQGAFRQPNFQLKPSFREKQKIHGGLEKCKNGGHVKVGSVILSHLTGLTFRTLGSRVCYVESGTVTLFCLGEKDDAWKWRGLIWCRDFLNTVWLTWIIVVFTTCRIYICQLKSILIGRLEMVGELCFSNHPHHRNVSNNFSGLMAKNTYQLLQKFSHQQYLTLHHSFAPATFALMFAGWDESDFGGKVTLAAWQDLRGISLIASEVTNANYYKAVEWMLHFGACRSHFEWVRVGLKRHIFDTNQGASVPFDPAQITCPLDLRLTEIQVAKTWGGKGWSEIWNKRVLSRLPWNFWLYRGYLFKIHTLKSHDTTSCKICTTWPLAGLCSKSHASRCLSQLT